MTEHEVSRRRIVVFGATGGTGSQVVDVALSEGFDVVAAVRRPEAVAPRTGLTVVRADVLDATSVASAIDGAHAVISTVGPARNRKPGTVISTGTRNLIAACTAAGVSRFVLESGIVCSDGRELSASGRFAARLFGLVYPELKADKLTAEAEVRSSSLAWVIVRPPALKDAPARGGYVAGPDARIAPAKSIPHADCAEVLVHCAVDDALARRIINVGRKA